MRPLGPREHLATEKGLWGAPRTLSTSKISHKAKPLTTCLDALENKGNIVFGNNFQDCGRKKPDHFKVGYPSSPKHKESIPAMLTGVQGVYKINCSIDMENNVPSLTHTKHFQGVLGYLV